MGDKWRPAYSGRAVCGQCIHVTKSNNKYNNTMNMMNDVRKGMGLEVIQSTESLLTFKQYILKEI